MAKKQVDWKTCPHDLQDMIFYGPKIVEVPSGLASMPPTSLASWPKDTFECGRCGKTWGIIDNSGVFCFLVSAQKEFQRLNDKISSLEYELDQIKYPDRGYH